MKLIKDILAQGAAYIMLIILFVLIIKSDERHKQWKLNGRSKCMPNEYVQFNSFRKIHYYAYPGAVAFCREQIDKRLGGSK